MVYRVYVDNVASDDELGYPEDDDIEDGNDKGRQEEYDEEEIEEEEVSVEEREDARRRGTASQRQDRGPASSGSTCAIILSISLACSLTISVMFRNITRKPILARERVSPTPAQRSVSVILDVYIH